MKELTLKEIQDLLGYEVKIVADRPGRKLSDVPIGETFKIGDLEFIVLNQNDVTTEVILKDFWKRAVFGSETNNYALSEIRDELRTHFYNKLVLLCGKDNIIGHSVDLTSNDGRKDYGQVYEYVSLLTCDRYRKYVDILDKYRPDGQWWTVTSFSTKSNDYGRSVSCVDNNGALFYISCYSPNGVRPFCILNSSISVE